MLAILAAMLVLAAQVYFNVIGSSGIRGREISIFAPYAILMVCFALYHAARTPWLISNEHLEAIQAEKLARQKIEAELQRERESGEAKLQKERDLAHQPDVVLAWGWTEEQIRTRSMTSGWDKYILVDNRSDEHVYNVQIESISLLRGLAFDPIPEIGPRATCLAIARWDGGSIPSKQYPHFFARAESEAKDKGWYSANAQGRQVFKIPMTLKYECAKHSRWFCRFEFVHDIGENSFFLKREGGRIQ
jgi:hypothetical protein